MERIAAPGLLAFALAIAPPAVVVLPGCGSCNAAAYAGLVVIVIDAATGARICDATVVATDGIHTETLHPIGSGGGCNYAGAYERSGSYEVVASRDGRIASMTAVVTGDSCHVTTEEVTVTLPVAAGA